MAEFLTMDDAKDKFGSKNKTNAGLALGIIGTTLGVLGQHGGLGGMFSNNNSCNEGPNVWDAYRKQCGDAIELTRAIYDGRIVDLKEKFDIYKILDDKINALAVKDAQLEATLPLAMQLASVNAERYADNKVSKATEYQNNVNIILQRELDKKINGTMGLPWGDIITGIPKMPDCTMDVNCPKK